MKRVPWAALFILATFSGCTGSPSGPASAFDASVPATSDSISVPHFREGDAYTIRRTFESEQLVEHLGSARFVYDTKDAWRNGLHESLDPYGHLVPAYRSDQEVTPVEPPNASHFSYRTIEANQNSWLVLGAFDLPTSMRDYKVPLLVKEVNCRFRTEGYTAVHFSAQRTPMEWGTLRGRTVHAGDVVVWSSDFGDGGHEYNLTVRLTALQRTTARLEGIDVQAMRVNQTSVLRFASKEYTNYRELVVAHGVPEPVETFDAKREFVELMRSYKPGDKPFKPNPELWEAQYAGVHREAERAKPDFVPPEGDPVEFSLADAERLVKTFPGAITFQLWYATHPTAYVAKGLYHRDPANGTFTWEFDVTDGTEEFRVMARRQRATENSEGLDYALSGQVTPRPAYNRVSGADFRALEVVPLAVGLQVSSAFLNRPASWDYAGWTTYRDDDGSAIRFFAAPGYEYRDGGVITESRSWGYGWAPHVLGDLGRITGGASGTGWCSYGLV